MIINNKEVEMKELFDENNSFLQRVTLFIIDGKMVNFEYLYTYNHGYDIVAKELGISEDEVIELAEDS